MIGALVGWFGLIIVVCAGTVAMAVDLVRQGGASAGGKGTAGKDVGSAYRWLRPLTIAAYALTVAAVAATVVRFAALT